MAPRAVLVGLPGSGKSTIGRRLAKALGLTLLDTDAAIEETTGRTIADIFATDGEQEFRRIEEEVIRSALQTHDGVLSLGGGAVTTPGVRDALAGHTVIYLEISAAEGVRRTGGSTVRPLLAGPDRAEKYKALMDARVPLYRRVATMRVNTNRRNPGAVVRHIVARLEKSAPRAEAATPAPPTPNRPRRRRRPPWRRDAAKDQQESDGPPTPAIMAARAAERASDPHRDTTLEKNT
ncbi:shikimate kinase [Mycolicibacterium monacense]|uniref:Shikimate kinase n=4 Tax=Mycobacteriaceae TaxID=1762 RepID=A0AAD1IVY3_MYCMB|nr:shikimate kinase [Mycolicibacterium monacense]MDA4105132.1 shikimate kinase [Mycolicibacterium monacense DSM 44395]OBB76413.1 shikimate kinase [Mycolicibacterium monacense]OBF48515.1 shikimate kinase [Mycolicibacterium monacense]ORB19558.1 shikimate kinase [Mycolicibacterium monacense DSM 44395]QHP86034.1 shikimate kinase [Mycolicibacterium monacense DSM 44395]